MFIVQHNLPFLLIEHLVNLIKAVASDSTIVKDLKIGKGKAQYTTIDIIMKEGLEVMGKILQENKFSLIIDEATDIGTNKCLALVVRYYEISTGKIRDRFLAMLEVTNGTALAMHERIISFFMQYKIPISNLIGFASDNASVMTAEALVE